MKVLDICTPDSNLLPGNWLSRPLNLSFLLGLQKEVKISFNSIYNFLLICGKSRLIKVLATIDPKG
jgi:hypothetical protein